MNWTETHKARIGISPYDHVICVTPIGVFLIEWKSWKDLPSFDITLNDSYIGTQYSLEEAKETATEYLLNKFIELQNFTNDLRNNTKV